jgi:hypothetical protein
VAIFHLSVKTVSRSAGRSSTAAAAYRAGVEITDRQTGEVHDYRRKAGVESAELFLPAGAPKWATDRAELWNAVEVSEKRKNSTVAREFEIALPAELSADQRRDLAHDFTKELVKKYGFAADCAIHLPGKDGDSKNHHAHILCTTRKLTSEGFTEKTRELDDRATGSVQVIECRELFASMTNAALERAGHTERVDHRSLDAQGIDREPTEHLGPAASAIERRGEVSQKTKNHQERQAEAASKVAALIAIAEAQAKAEQDAENDRIRRENFEFIDGNVNAAARAIEASARAGKATDNACAFAVQDHASIDNSLRTAGGNLGRAVQAARGHQHHSHAGAVAQALGRSLERLVPAIAGAARQVVTHLVELEKRAKPPAIPIQQTRAAVPPPAPSLADLVKASFARFVEWITRSGGKHVEIDTQRSDHYGPVVQLDDLHAVQRTGGGKFAIHQLDRLDKLPALDDPKMEIKYRDGLGTVTGKEAGKEIGR